jgi:hypothetical protein
MALLEKNGNVELGIKELSERAVKKFRERVGCSCISMEIFQEALHEIVPDLGRTTPRDCFLGLRVFGLLARH